MNYCDPTTLVAGSEAVIGAYQVAAQACLLAICNDTSLTVLFGSENLLDDSVVVIPALESIKDRQLLARHRGLLDSYAFMKQFHDPVVHLVNPVELKSLKLALDRCVEQHVHLIQRLASQLHRHLMARQRRGWLDEQDEGELDTNKLTRLITDPASPISYRVETQAPVRSTTVTILVDNSRSMLGKPIELAAVCTEL